MINLFRILFIYCILFKYIERKTEKINKLIKDRISLSVIDGLIGEIFKL